MNTPVSKKHVLVVSPLGKYAAVLAGIAMMLVIPSAMNADVTGMTGGGQSHTNIQPSVALNYIIALEGVFPSRNLTDGEAGTSSLELFGDAPLIGEVTMFAGNFAPRGWALTDGQLLAINSNEALFSILGTTYGGDGRTTFGLPNLRGRTPVGPRTGPGLSPRKLGEKGGAETATVSALQMPAHHHGLPEPINQTQNSGGGQGYTNMQPFLGLNPIIATQGLFPSRNLTGGDTIPINGASSEPYLADITYFAGNFAPRGWSFADGQILPISQNQALFSLLGTTYGGDGRTSFALPDLRGRTPIGPRSGPGLSTRTLGEKVGAETTVLSVNQLPSHNHSLPLPSNLALGNTGGNQAHSNMEPSLGLNYIIALVGVFPSRSLTDGGESEISLAGVDPYIGEVSIFAGNFAPRGWAFADGQLLPISTNTALFSILGTTYGGDGRTTFGLPDLRGRAAVHQGPGPGLSNWRLGQRGGVETISLALNQLPAHSHIIDPTPADFGDTDGDWDVDKFDYNTFRGQFGLKALPGVLASDIDEDGDVDLHDFVLLRQGFRFGVAVPSAPEPLVSSAPIPEPATLCLLAFGGLAVLKRRRR